MDRLPPFDQLTVLRAELESDFLAGPEERKRRKRDRIDEILEMLDTDDMNRAVFKVVAGKNWEQRITEYLDDENGTVDDVIRVVDTDMNRIYNDSVLDVGEKANAGRVEWTNEDVPAPDPNGKVMKTWVTMADDRVRDTHQYLEGMSVPVNSRFFTYDNDSARYPGDFADPQNNCGCRCRISLSMA